MRMGKRLKNVLEAIRDTDRKISERIFILLTLLAVAAGAVALIGDLITKENIYEIIVLTGTVLFIPAITLICLHKNRMDIAIRLVVLGIVFIILPTIFFFGGGLEGGGVLWFILAFLYIGLVLSGRWRTVMLTILCLLAFSCYHVGYYHPEYVVKHTKEIFYLDSFLSLILVGMVCFTMVLFQNRIYQEENTRAKKETERAEELNRSQNRFFSSMSHEIRTPINSILGLNELILREPDASDEIAKDAAGIQGAGKMLLALINDILDFSKIEAGSMDIVPVDYQVGDMMSEIVNMIWLRAQDKGLNLEVSIDPQVPSALFGDEVRIKQILINLLNNAVKYTKEGSVGLHIESEAVSKEMVLLRISVSDTGMGIKKESIPNLFDAFKRVDEQKNRHIEGTGLGLSIVKQLVELMDGTISVDSVYGEGTTFTVVVKQGVSDAEEIGELNIHNYGKAKKNAYESSFTAPEASVLIVDDNEMNLEVEKKLLTGTKMKVETAVSGKDALRMTLKNLYDVILMDHLMPEMDGIECLHEIRKQEGGLNNRAPVVVLTANAGGENRKLYNLAGFDGYLVKPVSGTALEDMLLRYIPEEKLNVKQKTEQMSGTVNTYAGYARKTPIVVSCTSMCDIPDELVKKLQIPILPFSVRTEKGIFKDSVQMGADELIRHITAGGVATSFPPTLSEYTDFFAEILRGTHHLIHIAITTGMSDDYYSASEAAETFENVTVINSECLSSATGILVLIAYKLMQQEIAVDDLVNELEQVKRRLRCSFIVDTTDYMARRAYIGKRLHSLAKALSLHPSLSFKHDETSLGGVWMGNTKYAYKKYIHKAFPVDIIPDSDIVFITYAAVPEETLLWIREEISKVAYFEHIVFQQASAAISSNCGPGTFGILYFVKGNKSYHIASLFPEASEDFDREDGEMVTDDVPG
ncbi:MAG: DegV family EDD domain-containing protein, partial [Lachnospiraceae bacterium]|nr:DegV family EDD domain-containing protein [Lachnospiraceae bacterium]